MCFEAIGHSTNLITPQSNIIVIRGSKTGKPVYDQILNAVEEFFPDSGILDENGRPTNPITAKPEVVEGPQSPVQQDEGGGPLRRVDTGISSIVGPDNGDRPGGFVLVIDGAGLSEALADDAHKTLLLRLAMLCEGVICCRVSPLQKALMVKLIRDSIGSMTLAIGDGANDVSMIQVGIISSPLFVHETDKDSYLIGSGYWRWYIRRRGFTSRQLIGLCHCSGLYLVSIQALW